MAQCRPGKEMHATPPGENRWRPKRYAGEFTKGNDWSGRKARVTSGFWVGGQNTGRGRTTGSAGRALRNGMEWEMKWDGIWSVSWTEPVTLRDSGLTLVRIE